MRPPARRLAILLLCLPAGCAVRPPSRLAAVAPAALAPPAAEAGVILAERPLQPRRAGDVRTAILATLGDAGVPAQPQPRPVEFIVRVADGAMLSVVQDNPQGLRPGERVVIHRVPHTMLSRIIAVASSGPGA